MRENLSHCRIVNTNSELDGREVIVTGIAEEHDTCTFYIISAVFGESFNGYNSTIMISSCLENL